MDLELSLLLRPQRKTSNVSGGTNAATENTMDGATVSRVH